jgi:hypothetical protein
LPVNKVRAMKRIKKKRQTGTADFPKNLHPTIKPFRNTRTRIRQLLRSFIPLHSHQEGEAIEPLSPN